MTGPVADIAFAFIQDEEGLNYNIHSTLAGVLCLLAAAVSSAGGLGGGAVFLPILILVAGVPLKQAAAFTAFMVVGNSAVNVLCTTVLLRNRGQLGINYGVAALSEPCLLLGVSVGVMSNRVFPEWLVTLLFAVVVAFSAVKTCRTGVKRWKDESDKADATRENVENAVAEPLLRARMEQEPERLGSSGTQLKALLVLVLVWICFFAIQVVTVDKQQKIIPELKLCSWPYWVITASQFPLALLFTGYTIYERNQDDQQKQAVDHAEDRKATSMAAKEARTGKVSQYLFPVAALLAGVLSGLFGIGGGILINPALLQMGIHPQVTAATCAFMMLFTSSMTSAQYLLLGTAGAGGLQAVALAAGCGVASAIGFLARQRCVQRHGRPSLIVFAVSVVMALSAVSMSCLGALDVWRAYKEGGAMGFKALC